LRQIVAEFVQQRDCAVDFTAPRWSLVATTTFMYSVYPLSNVKFIGYKTGGGAGSVASGILSNGWLWDLSVSEFIDYK